MYQPRRGIFRWNPIFVMVSGSERFFSRKQMWPVSITTNITLYTFIGMYFSHLICWSGVPPTARSYLPSCIDRNELKMTFIVDDAMPTFFHSSLGTVFSVEMKTVPLDLRHHDTIWGCLVSRKYANFMIACAPVILLFSSYYICFPHNLSTSSIG